MHDCGGAVFFPSVYLIFVPSHVHFFYTDALAYLYGSGGWVRTAPHEFLSFWTQLVLRVNLLCNMIVGLCGMIGLRGSYKFMASCTLSVPHVTLHRLRVIPFSTALHILTNLRNYWSFICISCLYLRFLVPVLSLLLCRIFPFILSSFCLFVFPSFCFSFSCSNLCSFVFRVLFFSLAVDDTSFSYSSPSLLSFPCFHSSPSP